ncbi:centrosomal protein of 57 kDa isoform X2 [Corythoichthys intestinalis]|uniref:centrosomal protein of 57 kDa isoform X2 n=1 Tax=Corythoichthys intestinalis TaxID=161448 RepID=UPI0025A660C7|nr:centrosomal protein of 57 kDa isoform X2 [Corythoichthys intestinalis]XP_061797536.1 centrosomal protein of 57 kDa-like [Nerophis lumbriciformis]
MATPKTSAVVVEPVQKESNPFSHEPAGDCQLLPSYNEYPARRACMNPPSDHQDPYRPPSPSKGYPENNSAAILSALRHLQEKIRRLELENKLAERRDAQSPHVMRIMQRNSTSQTDEGRVMGNQSNCNQAVVTQLAATESRCANLERQLDHMRKLLDNARGEKSLLKQQVTMGASRSPHEQVNTASAHAHLQKILRLEQEYLRLTRTQAEAEVKIHELELKLQEEEHQRKLVQDKAKQLQSRFEANRILLGSGTLPRWSSTHPVERKGLLKKRPSYFEPHYRLNLRDVPFVAGTSVGGSHSVRANVQSVLSLLKHHQPQLCNSRVLGVRSRTTNRRHSDTSSASSSSGDLTELLQMLQDELRVMSLEQDELMHQLDRSVPLQERKQLEREQETLLLKMERKGEQIAKIYKHKLQMKKFRKETCRNQPKARAPKPGEKSKYNLRLLKDMKALQTSLST